MQTNNCKNQNTQLPTQVVAEKQFHNVLTDFFESNDVQGHVKTLTALCRAFTGIAPDVEPSRMDIANMVFAADLIRQFIRDMARLSTTKGGGCTEIEAQIIEQSMFANDADQMIEVVSIGLQNWIYPDVEPQHTIEYLNESIFRFQTIADLIKVCSKIHLTAENRLEGGAVC